MSVFSFTNINSSSNLNTILGYVNELGVQFGVNGWQLQSGTYNGEYFYLGPSILGNLNAEFNPAAGIVSATTSLLGLNDNEDNSDLGQGNIITSNLITDNGKAKVQVFSPPNNSDIFEDMGVYGETFQVTAIIAGSSYQKATSNFFYKALNPVDAGVSPADLYVLNHPIFGEIDDVRLLEWKRIHTSKLWRASIWQLTFRSSEPLFQIIDESTSLLNTILSKIANIIQISQGILNTYGAVKSTYNTVIKNVLMPGNTSFTESPIYESRISLSGLITYDSTSGNLGDASSEVTDLTKTPTDTILFAVNNTLLGMQDLINNFAPSNFSSPLLASQVYNPAYVWPQMNYFTSMAPGDVNNLVNMVDYSIDIAIAVLNLVNDNSIYPLITALNELNSNFGSLTAAIMNNYLGTTKQYTVPYDMDMVTLCDLNNLSFTNKATIIFNMNSNIIPSYNYISKNLILTIPLA